LPKNYFNPIQLLQIFDTNEREQFKILLNTDWIYAKKGEPHSWAFFGFYLTLVVLSYAQIQNWINVPHMSDSIIFGGTVAVALLFFSLINVFLNYELNIKGVIWERLIGFYEFFNQKTKTKLIKLFMGIIFIISGLSIFIWPFISLVFPLLLLWFFVFPNLPSLLNDLLNNLVGLILITFFLNYLVEFMAVPYGINLVENIKNEKIWWLEKIKLDINEFSPGVNTDEKLKMFYKKFDCSDIYIPIPIQRFFMFQKYVLYPKWVGKPDNDLDNCADSDFKILKERMDFHKNLIYRNIEQ
jgi:hypothetical protein